MGSRRHCSAAQSRFSMIRNRNCPRCGGKRDERAIGQELMMVVEQKREQRAMQRSAQRAFSASATDRGHMTQSSLPLPLTEL